MNNKGWSVMLLSIGLVFAMAQVPDTAIALAEETKVDQIWTGDHWSASINPMDDDWTSSTWIGKTQDDGKGKDEQNREEKHNDGKSKDGKFKDGKTKDGKQAGKKKGKAFCITPKMVKLKTDMQRVWIDHTIWTRSYIVSAISNRADQKYVLDRLLRNQQDIGNTIKPFYGDEAGDKLAGLLREHILIAGKIVEAAKAGQQDQVEQLQKDWHRNADDIARFLSEANPYWPFEKMQEMMYTHLKLITEIVLDCLKGDWQGDIEATDKNETHMIHLANILTRGIIRQFPDMFK